MQYLSFYELADEFGVGIDFIRRNVRRLGLQVHARVTPTSKGAGLNHLSIEDSQSLRSHFESAALKEAIDELESRPS